LNQSQRGGAKEITLKLYKNAGFVARKQQTAEWRCFLAIDGLHAHWRKCEKAHTSSQLDGVRIQGLLVMIKSCV
jgi:hypothetical protein